MNGKYNCRYNPKENTKIETCESALVEAPQFIALCQVFRSPLFQGTSFFFFFFNSLFSYPFLLPSPIHFCCVQCPGKLVPSLFLAVQGLGKYQSGRSVTRRPEELVCVWTSWKGESICVSYKCPPEGIPSRRGPQKINGRDITCGCQSASFSRRNHACSTES